MQGIIETNDMPNRAAHLRAMQIARTWGTRLSLEFCEEQHHEILRKALGLPDSPSRPTFELDQVFADYLQTHFTNAIPKDDFFIVTGILDGYKASVMSKTQTQDIQCDSKLISNVTLN